MNILRDYITEANRIDKLTKNMKAKNIEQSIWNNMNRTDEMAEKLAATLNRGEALARAVRIFVGSGWLVELPQKAQDTIQKALKEWEKI